MIRCAECVQMFERDAGEATEDGWTCYDCIEDARAQAKREAEDRRLDDPRHGQAADLNRGRR